MTKPESIQQRHVATPVKGNAPVVQTGSDSQGRVVKLARLHYDTSKALFSKQATSKNGFIAAMQKTGYVAAAVITAIGETVRNVFAGLYDVVFAIPVNFVGGLIKKEEKVEKQAKQAAVQLTAPEAEAAKVKPPVAPSHLQRFVNGVSNTWNTIKNNRGKTAAVVAGAAAIGIASYYGFANGGNPNPKSLLGLGSSGNTCPNPESLLGLGGGGNSGNTCPNNPKSPLGIEGDNSTIYPTPEVPSLELGGNILGTSPLKPGISIADWEKREHSNIESLPRLGDNSGNTIYPNPESQCRRPHWLNKVTYLNPNPPPEFRGNSGNTTYSNPKFGVKSRNDWVIALVSAMAYLLAFQR